MENRKAPPGKKPLPGGEEALLALWQKRLSDSRGAQSGEMAQMARRRALYEGDKQIGGAKRKADNVRNLVFELIESEVDASIPQPRVTARCPEDAHLAAVIEDLLRAQLTRLPFARLNDLDERITYIQGGSFFHVEWDAEAGTHTQGGDLSVTVRHPCSVLVQPGTARLEDAQWLILQVKMSRQAAERRWAQEPGSLSGERGENCPEEQVVCSFGYWKTGDGAIGRFVWCGDVPLEYDDRFGGRKFLCCTRCGRPKKGPVCRCGGSRFAEGYCGEEELEADILRRDGSIIPAKRPAGSVQVRLDEKGEARFEDVSGKPTRIPCYLPRRYPLVLRQNVSRSGHLLGASDVDCIADQQETVKKLGSKLGEKLLKGGSYVTLPRGVDIELTDRELKVIRLDSPAQKALIDVLTVQPDVSRDLALLRENYEWARSTLGITDSYQGKADSTATSAVAKQFSAAQASGRLESKRRMKNEAYRELFRLMFEYLLAYADEPIPVPTVDEQGRSGYTTFDRYDFLKQDEAGEWYWNDAFLFDVDATGGLAQNREAMWKKLDEKFAAGALGDRSRTETLLRYWTLLEQHQFPGAKTVKKLLEQQKGEDADALPQLQNTAADRPGVPAGDRG